jgi:hypothetical protein
MTSISGAFLKTWVISTDDFFFSILDDYFRFNGSISGFKDKELLLKHFDESKVELSTSKANKFFFVEIQKLLAQRAWNCIFALPKNKVFLLVGNRSIS